MKLYGFKSVSSVRYLFLPEWPLMLLEGSLTELMGDPEGAIDAYQQALRHNQWSVAAMNAISHILRAREKFPEAMEYLRSILKLDPNNGDVWGSLGMPEPHGGLNI
jgi:tetratricopeptide (TPR) repeat protein